jgi:hypothetical protein
MVAVAMALAEPIDFVFKPFSDFIMTKEDNPGCLQPSPTDILSSPHSNSFVDFDGDCIPDLFLQKTKKQIVDGKTLYSVYYEIYIQKALNDSNRFCLLHTDIPLTSQPA